MKNKNIRNKVIQTLLIFSLMMISGDTVLAAENEISLELPVKQILDVPKDISEQVGMKGTYELTGLTEEAPMPENSENGGLTSEVIVENGSGKKCGEICFTNRYDEKNNSNPPDKSLVKTGDEHKIGSWIMEIKRDAYLFLTSFCEITRNRFISLPVSGSAGSVLHHSGFPR